MIIILTVNQKEVTHWAVPPLESYVDVHFLGLSVILHKAREICSCIDCILRFKPNQIDGGVESIPQYYVDVIKIGRKQQ